ncbi:MAG: PLDc N-terminal domain-containing protein, partial [Bacilli bacterium]
MLWLLGLYLLNTALVLAVAVREAVHPARALAWASVCTLLPVIGFLLYSVLSRSPAHRRSQASHRPQRRLPRRHRAAALHPGGSALQQAVVHAVGEWSGQEPAPASVRLLI